MYLTCSVYAIKCVQESTKTASCSEFVYSLERLLGFMIPHTGQMPCSCPIVDPQWSLLSQLLTVPFLWRLFPHLNEVSVSLNCYQGSFPQIIGQMAKVYLRTLWHSLAQLRNFMQTIVCR